MVESLPGPVRLSLALTLELELAEVELVHEVRVTLAKDGKELLGLSTVSSLSSHGLSRERPCGCRWPSTSRWPAEEAGAYDVRVSTNGGTPRFLRFYVVVGAACRSPARRRCLCSRWTRKSSPAANSAANAARRHGRHWAAHGPRNP